MNGNSFRCVFGDHKYYEKVTKDKQGFHVHMCIHCKLNGYYKLFDGTTVWIEYYPNGYPKREVYSNGSEVTYYPNGKYQRTLGKNGGTEYRSNTNGINIYLKYKDGTEEWKYKGEWVKEKSKNWDPENE